jgi:regulator of protease activity HflC (stomatin/prohibitin superfamily)
MDNAASDVAADLDGVDSPEYLSRRRRVARGLSRMHERFQLWIEVNGFGVAIGALLLLFVMVFFWNWVVVTVPAGYKGVMWKRLSGTDVETLYLEGTHVILPWNRLQLYDVRIQRIDTIVTVLSTDGLEIDTHVSVRYRPVERTLPLLHQTVGPDYANRIVIPEVIAAVRSVMGQYRPQQLFAVRSEEMQNRIIERAAKQARDRFVSIDDVLIGKIELPPIVQTAIQLKLKQEQEAQEYEYRIARENKEKERKMIEADGIREYQSRIATFTPSLLQWKGIEATERLATSPNSKVIVIGGRDGLPLILDTATMTGALSGGQTQVAAPTSSAAPTPLPLPNRPPGTLPPPK